MNELTHLTCFVQIANPDIPLPPTPLRANTVPSAKGARRETMWEYVGWAR